MLDGKRVILFIGPDEAVSGFALQAVESQGYLVVRASDGRQAWRLVSALMPDAIVLGPDQSMAEGFDFEREFRRTYEYGVPILHMRNSAYFVQR